MCICVNVRVYIHSVYRSLVYICKYTLHIYSFIYTQKMYTYTTYIQGVASLEPKKIEPIASSAGRMSFLKKWHYPCIFFIKCTFSAEAGCHIQRETTKQGIFGGIIRHKFAIFYINYPITLQKRDFVESIL